MFYLVTQRVLSRDLRLFIRRSISKQWGFTVINWSKYASFRSQWLTHNFNKKLPTVGRLASSTRFFSEDRIPSIDLEEEDEGHQLPSVVQTYQTASVQSRRISPFLKQLKHCGSPSDVLDLTCKYAPTPRQVSNCLTQMWFTTKKMSEDQRRYELQLMFNHPAFDRLLQSSIKAVGHLNTEAIAYSLLSMVNLGVPQRSRVVQTFLRHCQEKLNDFDEKGLSILASCLVHMEENANVAALKEGMRMMVEMRLPEIKSVLALQTMMRVLGKDTPLDLKRKLEVKVLSMTDQFTLPNTQYMISTMATMGFYSKPLLDICSKKMIENLHGIPFNRLLPVLLSCRELYYRDLDLLNGISDYVASLIDVWTNKQLLLLLSAFESLAFCPDALMKALTEKIIGNPGALTLKDILCVLKVYSSLNYDLKHQRQLFLDGVTQALCSYLPMIPTFELLRSVYYLSVLGCFPSAPLQQLMNEDSINQLKATAPRIFQNQENMLRTVDLCLRLDAPALPVPLILPSFLLGETTSRCEPSVKPWLSHSLKSLLEEQENAILQEMLLVENFYLIGKVRFPTVSIIALISSSNACCYGTSRPRGPLAVMIRHLKILGYDCVLMMDQELESMSEQHRLDFLRTCIFPESRRPEESLTE
uniref:FAST kinase domains 2 n=1 Tax=Takifugu rubripes TaxID=31033 RepID=A0A674MBJ4_TAKRU